MSILLPKSMKKDQSDVIARLLVGSCKTNNLPILMAVSLFANGT